MAAEALLLPTRALSLQRMGEGESFLSAPNLFSSWGVFLLLEKRRKKKERFPLSEEGTCGKRAQRGERCLSFTKKISPSLKKKPPIIRTGLSARVLFKRENGGFFHGNKKRTFLYPRCGLLTSNKGLFIHWERKRMKSRGEGELHKF